MYTKLFNLFMAFGLFLLLFRCSNQPDNPTGPDELNISISLLKTEATPGTILTLTTNKSLSPVNNFSLFFDDGESPILATSEDKIYEVIVPNVPSGNVNVYLENKSDKKISEPLSFSILTLPATGLPFGQVVSEVVTSQKNSYIIIRDSIIPKLQTIGILSVTNSSLFQGELTRSITIFQKLEQQIQSHSDKEKEKLDQLLYSAGILDLVSQGRKSINKIASTSAVTSEYTAHHICAALDGFSAILTAIEKVWTLAGLIASAGSAGSLSPIVCAVSIAIASIDYCIDGFLPTDLNELYVDTQDNINVPLNSSTQIRIMGKFVPQSNPINESIEFFVSALLDLVDIGVTKSFIINMLVSIGIEVNDNINGLTEKWQSINYVEHRIDPSYYEGGFGALLIIFGDYLGINISNARSQDFLKTISSFNYHVANPSIASFNDENSTLSGLQIGTSQLIYNGYRFKKFDGWAGILTLGIEWPELLSDDKIKKCEFTVQQISGNETGTVTDIDGNTYRTVKIGNQWWMAENLKVTHYRNGNAIPHTTNNSTWPSITTGAYRNLYNDETYVATYGRLYNWYAINDSRKIAPEGWHVPTDEDWKTLEMYLGMSQINADNWNWRGTDEGAKLKETGTEHWTSPNTGTNESGFSALPGGYVHPQDGSYNDFHGGAYFWTSFETQSGFAVGRHLNYRTSSVYRYNYDKRYGFSIRCVKD